jgi:hypothetical protein
VQLPAPPPMAAPAAAQGQSRFGGPPPAPGFEPGQPAAVLPTGQHRHAYAGASTGGSRLTPKTMALVAVAVVLVLAAGFFGWTKLSGSSDSAAPPAAGSGNAGPRGALAVTVAKADLLGVANAEEGYFSLKQAYVPVKPTTGLVDLGNFKVYLSPQDTVSVTLNPAGSAFCEVVTTTSPTTSASSKVVYISTAGGLQPAGITSCPASF